MDFQRLRTFRTVATLMNFNQAAQVLNYAQSSISAQIKTLEDEIGAQLFKRTGKKVTLTEAGEKMLDIRPQAVGDRRRSSRRDRRKTESALPLDASHASDCGYISPTRCLV